MVETRRPRQKNCSRPRPKLAYEGLRPTLAIPEIVQDRVLNNYTVDDAGCWISNYTSLSNGYAQISYQGKTYLAHRASYTKANGQIPQGMVVDHMCFTRKCVNPEHLRTMTISDNSRRKKGADFPLGQCANGHPDSFMREYYWAEGLRRKCTECMREKALVNAAKRKAKAAVERSHSNGQGDPES